MEISISGSKLLYRTNGKKYITTYVNSYNEKLDSYLEEIFTTIFPFYSTNELAYSNVCGANAEFICNKVVIDGHKLGKIIIVDWVKPNKQVLSNIESVYGPIGFTIDSTYHALAYFEIMIDKNINYVAIETTICVPYKLQYYVAKTSDELKEILKARYQCNDFKISFDCNKPWSDIAYSYTGGNKKRKNTKSKTIKRTRSRTRTNKKTKTKTIKRKRRRHTIK